MADSNPCQRRKIQSTRISRHAWLLYLCLVASREISALRRHDRPRRSIITLDLHPSAARWEERRLSPSNETYPPAHWFEAEQNAVYASIPDPLDERHINNRHLQDFHAYRHLSRYERQYRIQNGLDLQANWDGNYNLEDSIWNTTLDASLHRQLQSESQAHYGGQFDNYQAVPLSQGYGTHFANVWVGSPTPQRKTVIVDTGSHYTAFPCLGCQQCGGPHHTDPYFNPQKSTTFHQLQCDECQDGVICENGKCIFTQSYTEGSSWAAVQVKDRLFLGGTDVLDSVEPNDEKYAIDFMFGCQTSMSGLFVTQLADGISGMSAHPATLPKQLYDRRILEHNMFAMCYRRELGTSKRGVTAGSMTLGGISDSLDTSPMIYAKNMAKIGWYTVYVKNIYIRSGGGQSAKSNDPKHKTIKVKINAGNLNSGKGIIVDSGTLQKVRSVCCETSRTLCKFTALRQARPIHISTRLLHRILPRLGRKLQAKSTLIHQCG